MVKRFLALYMYIFNDINIKPGRTSIQNKKKLWQENIHMHFWRESTQIEDFSQKMAQQLLRVSSSPLVLHCRLIK